MNYKNAEQTLEAIADLFREDTCCRHGYTALEMVTAWQNHKPAPDEEIAALKAKLANSESELAKWEDGCRRNADALMDMGRVADNHRLATLSALKERNEAMAIVDRCEELLPILRDIASSYRMQTLDRHGVTLRKMETADEIIAAIQALRAKK